eukprot:scaffold388_cov244-Pinguiococcus_pyrenoidosus.AAC.18
MPVVSAATSVVSAVSLLGWERLWASAALGAATSDRALAPPSRPIPLTCPAWPPAARCATVCPARSVHAGASPGPAARGLDTLRGRQAACRRLTLPASCRSLLPTRREPSERRPAFSTPNSAIVSEGQAAPEDSLPPPTCHWCP